MIADTEKNSNKQLRNFAEEAEYQATLLRAVQQVPLCNKDSNAGYYTKSINLGTLEEPIKLKDLIDWCSIVRSLREVLYQRCSQNLDFTIFTNAKIKNFLFSEHMDTPYGNGCCKDLTMLNGADIYFLNLIKYDRIFLLALDDRERYRYDNRYSAIALVDCDDIAG